MRCFGLGLLVAVFLLHFYLMKHTVEEWLQEKSDEPAGNQQVFDVEMVTEKIWTSF